MRTIGKHRPRSSPLGDFQCLCDYCGVGYLRSQLTRDGAGFLACREDFGRDQVTLAKLIAQDSARPKRGHLVKDGGNWDHQDDPPSTGNPSPYTGPHK